MSGDDRTVTINLHESIPLVSSSSSLNGANNHNLSAKTSGNNGGSTATTPTANSGSRITIQSSMPGSNSFIVGTKANQSFISDAPITDPGGSTTKQVRSISIDYRLNTDNSNSLLLNLLDSHHSLYTLSSTLSIRSNQLIFIFRFSISIWLRLISSEEISFFFFFYERDSRVNPFWSQMSSQGTREN